MMMTNAEWLKLGMNKQLMRHMACTLVIVSLWVHGMGRIEAERMRRRAAGL